jgi:hypothetical protein
VCASVYLLFFGVEKESVLFHYRERESALVYAKKKEISSLEFLFIIIVMKELLRPTVA